ncbi:Uncharacterised protein [Kluyvera cryocrescens]|uniref:Uncharacterized protein n=1 Tax=Kluyvera cryocrescens TaxID=580 RepID=A0A485A6F4_KLUCR|nr:Uncharacterised protein [Kluyvera cryocrescens]
MVGVAHQCRLMRELKFGDGGCIFQPMQPMAGRQVQTAEVAKPVPEGMVAIVLRSFGARGAMMQATVYASQLGFARACNNCSSTGRIVSGASGQFSIRRRRLEITLGQT